MQQRDGLPLAASSCGSCAPDRRTRSSRHRFALAVAGCVEGVAVGFRQRDDTWHFGVSDSPRLGAFANCGDRFGRCGLKRILNILRQTAGSQDKEIRRHPEYLGQSQDLKIGRLPLARFNVAEQRLRDSEFVGEIGLR